MRLRMAVVAMALQAAHWAGPPGLVLLVASVPGDASPEAVRKAGEVFVQTLREECRKGGTPESMNA